MPQEPFPEPLREPKPFTDLTEVIEPETGSVAGLDTGTSFEATPDLPDAGVSVAAGQRDSLGSDLTGEPIQTSFNGAPLVAFINEVLGNQLGLSYVVSPEVQNSEALVTLRLTEALAPADYFDLVRSVLAEYGIGLTERQSVITVVLSNETAGDEVPLLISGRTSPDVPVSHRTVFQLVPLQVTTPRNVTGWFRQIFPDRELVVLDDGARNAVVLKGRSQQVAQAVEMIDVLDQPAYRAQTSIIVEPEFLQPRVLARSLEQVLKTEGYEVGLQPGYGVATLLALEDVGKLVVFAGSELLLDHIRNWIEVLDEQQRNSIKSGIFTYQVANVQVTDLLESLSGILSITSGPAPQSGQSAGGRAGKLAADKARNILVFKGSGEEWGELLSLVRVLDKPIPSVLIEVLIAEISLDDEVSSGLEFLAKSGVDGYTATLGTRDGFNVASNGLSIVVDKANSVRARLNFFERNERVFIRSSPRLLVKSGASASIEVGNEIPVITQSEASSVQQNGNSSIIQSRSYRKTGVQLEISPVVQANGLVDLEISQSLSEARPNATTTISGSPTILNRSLTTELSLRDGGSLLMGGIISNSKSDSVTGVPGLSRVPLLGRLFRNDSIQGDRTELIIMVTPYVIASYEEGWELTESMKRQLTLHEQAGGI